MVIPDKIALVGPMGAGKSTIGRLLAAELSMPFKDSDHVIEENSGADIPWIFDVEGEQGFRERETAVLRSLLTASSRLVLATGGGAVVLEENRQLLREFADPVVYLKAAPEFLLERTAKDHQRPLLQVPDRSQKIIALLQHREPFYCEVATHVITTDSASPKTVIQKIIESFS